MFHNDRKYPAGVGGGCEWLCILGNSDFSRTLYGKERWIPGLMNDKA